MTPLQYLACSLVLLAGCDSPSPEEEAAKKEQVSADEVLRSARETLGKTASFLDQERKVLADRLEKEALSLNQKIQELKKEAPERLGPFIVELERQRDELVRTWGQVQQLSAEKIEQVVRQMHHGWQETDLKSSLGRQEDPTERKP